MNIISERIFKNLTPNYDKLLAFGFTRVGDNYCYDTEILRHQFSLHITVTSEQIYTEVVDLATNEPYTLFLVSDAVGSFVGSVRTAYEDVMTEIAENCFDKEVFKSDYSKKLIEYVTKTYGDSLEFLWEKFPKNAVWRRKDNEKWYGALLIVPKSKLGLQSEEQIEILDLRMNSEDIEAVIDGKTIFYGYHMNKKHWVTVLLDGSVPLQTIKKMLNDSYALAKK